MCNRPTYRAGYALTLLIFIATAVSGIFVSSPAARAQSSAAPPVNVAATYLFVQCPELVSATAEVRFAYVQLDGNAAVRSATTENRGLIQAGNVPAVAFTRLSFDFSQDALYRFILADGDYIDILVEPDYWSVDRRNSILYTGLSC